ncbi:MAG: OmpP1/FadL family transporter [Thiotrichales bacterium]
MRSLPPRALLTTTIAALMASPAFATNGMNMEAYGAKAGGMGGASFGYDSGNSAVMNNPATLTLRADQQDVGVGLTVLMPDVAAEVRGTPAQDDSDGTSYLMPTLSYIRKRDQFAYGAALVAQGGMGTEYGRNSFLSLSGEEIRSEVGFGRFMLPLAYQVNNELSIAGQLDYVWAGMDLAMDMDGASLNQLAMGNGGSVGGTLAAALPSFQPSWARFEFSNSSDFTGQATGDGFGLKLGAHYKLNNAVAIGATYHSKTNISDMEGSGRIVMGTGMGPVPLSGDFFVRDFQWPETYGLGVAWTVNDKILLAGDIKRIMWSGTMDDFRVGFRANNADSNNFGPMGDFRGATLEVAMDQKWDDQTVLLLGGQYKLRPDVALRAGMNLASNPIPSSTVNPLFPAIVENHYTLGVGWRITPAHSLAASFAYAPEVTQTNPNTQITSSHAQSVLRVNYNFTF